MSTDLLAPRRFWLGRGGEQDLQVSEGAWAAAPASVKHENIICLGGLSGLLGLSSTLVALSNLGHCLPETVCGGWVSWCCTHHLDSLSPPLSLTFSAMQEVQASLEKSIHLYWSGEGSPEAALSGAKHLDPLLQMAQRHQPTPPDKGFLGTWSALGSQVQGGVFTSFWCFQLVTTPARMSPQDAEGRHLQQDLGYSSRVLLQCPKPSCV